jgi:ABC-type nitrate/sulfonate/bicarbonate transport system substrate-binding protein
MAASKVSGRKLKLAVPDLISNSYFPAVAAVELGFFAREGLDVSLELIFPVSKCYEALRDGVIDFVGGAAHAVLAAFPDWRGAKLIAAQAQGMYWFLVMRADLGARRGDLDVVEGKRIGAAPWVEMGLRQLLIEAGYDLARDGIEMVGIPPNPIIGPNFGLGAAKALEEGRIDGFWANGMGAEIAVTGGIGTVVLDIRRGDGPEGSFGYTFASIAATDRLIAEEPETVAAAVRAIVATQKALKADVALATEVGRKLFPPREADLIAGIVARDLPYYDASIARETVSHLNKFCRARQLLQGNPAFEAVVEHTLAPLWIA